MPFQIVRNDITKVKADAIVNTANPHPTVGNGTDGAIYEAAGEEQLLAERQKIGRIDPGEVAYTDAFRLSAKYIIHTVGPKWFGGKRGERAVLRSCYANSLRLAHELGCESLAIPLISTGIYGFPKDEALHIALEEINQFIRSHEMEVTLVVFDRKSFELSAELAEDIREFIDECTVRALKEREYRDGRRRRTWGVRGHGDWFPYEDIFESALDSDSNEVVLEESVEGTGAYIPKNDPDFLDIKGKNLKDVMKNPGMTFQKRLFQLIDNSPFDDVEVYKRANLTRQLFSAIRCNPNYKPKKKTVVALAIALKLDLATTQELLSSAGMILSASHKFDLIIIYFITNGIYDIYEINAALFEYDQPLLV